MRAPYGASSCLYVVMYRALVLFMRPRKEKVVRVDGNDVEREQGELAGVAVA